MESIEIEICFCLCITLFYVGIGINKYDINQYCIYQARSVVKLLSTTFVIAFLIQFVPTEHMFEKMLLWIFIFGFSTLIPSKSNEVKNDTVRSLHFSVLAISVLVIFIVNRFTYSHFTFGECFIFGLLALLVIGGVIALDWILSRYLYRKKNILLFLLLFSLLAGGMFFLRDPFFTVFFSLLLGLSVRNTVFGFPYRKIILRYSEWLHSIVFFACILLSLIVVYAKDLSGLNSSFFVSLVIVGLIYRLGYSKGITRAFFSISALTCFYLDHATVIILPEYFAILSGGALCGEVFLVFSKRNFVKFPRCLHTDLPRNKTSCEDALRKFKHLLVCDFSNAGVSETYDTSNLPVYNVLDYSIRPDSQEDQITKINDLIDKVGASGGGRICFPSGRYMLNSDVESGHYIKIDYSNVLIDGSNGVHGKETVFVSKSSTLNGRRNPWLSPFTINFATKLQSRNVFWGVQFKNKRETKTRSGSITDPGSDGFIQEPDFLCTLEKSAVKGDSQLHVRDNSIFRGKKYLLLAAFNKDSDGSLIKRLINREVIPAMWETPLRAGPEKAPSLQLLVEIRELIGNDRIVLKTPLWFDLYIEEDASIYDAPLIENVGLRNITFESEWEGMFRHHGAPLYFSKHQSQDMDYGWNGVNICRVANSVFENITFRNFTNPIYLQDSRNVTISNIKIEGHDGHQGIKLYGHSCDNLIQNVDFYCHFADMVGGEGNCYGNVFLRLQYLNQENHPADFDFHGCSEGPFSPPSFNLFDCCIGFRGIKAAGTVYNQPALGLGNTWWNINSAGFYSSNQLFLHDQYKCRNWFRLNVTTSYKTLIRILQKNLVIEEFFNEYSYVKSQLRSLGLDRKHHYKLFKNSKIFGYNSDSEIKIGDNSTDFEDEFILVKGLNDPYFPNCSLYEEQVKAKTSNV